MSSFRTLLPLHYIGVVTLMATSCAAPVGPEESDKGVFHSLDDGHICYQAGRGRWSCVRHCRDVSDCREGEYCEHGTGYGSICLEDPAARRSAPQPEEREPEPEMESVGDTEPAEELEPVDDMNEESEGLPGSAAGHVGADESGE